MQRGLPHHLDDNLTTVGTDDLAGSVDGNKVSWTQAQGHGHGYHGRCVNTHTRSSKVVSPRRSPTRLDPVAWMRVVLPCLSNRERRSGPDQHGRRDRLLFTAALAFQSITFGSTHQVWWLECRGLGLASHVLQPHSQITRQHGLLLVRGFNNVTPPALCHFKHPAHGQEAHMLKGGFPALSHRKFRQQA